MISCITMKRVEIDRQVLPLFPPTMKESVPAIAPLVPITEYGCVLYMIASAIYIAMESEAVSSYTSRDWGITHGGMLLRHCSIDILGRGRINGTRQQNSIYIYI